MTEPLKTHAWPIVASSNVTCLIWQILATLITMSQNLMDMHFLYC